MKIKIEQAVASATWTLRPDQIIDTKDHEFISDEQAMRWLNAGVATAVKERTRTGKKKAVAKRENNEVS